MRTMTPEVQELEIAEVEELVTLARAGAKHLALPMDAAPGEIVGAINTWLRAIEDDEQERPEDDTVMQLAVLLAVQYTRAFAWKWARITWDEDFAAHSVTAPDASIAIAPIQWVNAISKKEATTNVLLNFNMVAAGNVPPAKPGACVLFQ